MKHLVRYIILLNCLFCSLSAHAQVWSLTTEDGLSANSVKSFLQDSRGFIYIGTSVGVDRFDGASLVHIPFPIENKQELCWVSGMAEGNGFDLIVGNNAGLWKMDRRDLLMKRIFKNEIDWEVTCVRRALDGRIFVGTINGLFVVDDKQITRVQLYSNSHHNDQNVRDIAFQPVGKDYSVWVATCRNVTMLHSHDTKGGTTYVYPPGSEAVTINKIAASSDGRVFIGTGNGVDWLSQRTAHPQHYQLSSSVSAMSVMNGHLLVSTGTDGTFDYLLTTNQLVCRYTNQSGAGMTRLRGYAPFSFMRDSLGNNWTGYLFRGLDYSTYATPTFHTYIPQCWDGGDLPDSKCILIDGDRKLIGTFDGLYVVDERQQTIRQIGEDILGSKHVSVISRTSKGYLVGTIGGGIHLFDTNLKELPLPGAETLKQAFIYDITDDGQGGQWIASTAGLACYRGSDNSLKIYNASNSQLPDNEVFCFCFDQGGRGWIGTRGGICIYDNVEKRITNKNVPKQLAALGMLRHIISWDDGSLCFVPQHGMPVIAEASFTRFKSIQLGIFEEDPAVAFMNRVGNLIIFGTENGIYTLKDGKTRFYGHVSGVAGISVSSRGPYIDPHGNIWIATDKGYVYTSLRELEQQNHKHVAVIVNRIQNDHWFADDEVSRAIYENTIELSRSSNNLTVEFTPLIYGNSSDLRFRYRLKGYDDEWHMSSRNRVISFERIPMGNYTLEIQAVGMPEVSAAILVDVPYTWNALIQIFALLILLSFGGYVFYCRRYKKQYFWKRFMPQPQKYVTSSLDKRESQRLAKALTTYMEAKKPYLNGDLQMADLAKAIGTSSHTLSQVFSQHLNRSYYDYVAEYRVREFQRLARDPKYAKFTIAALSELCGFRSRNPFLTAFKKFTGLSPKAWLEAEKSGDS